MARLRRLSALLPILIWALGCNSQQLVTQTFTFPYFENVGTCAPFSYLIEQASDGKYAVEVQAEQGVLDHLLVLVQDGKSVGIQANGTFSSAQPVRITVRLPPGKLQYVETVLVNADVGVAGVAFSADKAEFAKNGNGSFLVSQPVNASFVKVSSVGNGEIVLPTDTYTADVNVEGNSTLYISGVKGSVTVRQSETSSLLLNTESGAVIQGVNTGTGPTSYTKGTCNVTNPLAQGVALGASSGSVCKQAGSLAAPSQTLLWTCGVNVTGPYLCAGGGFLGVPGNTPVPCAVPDSSRVMYPPAAAQTHR